MSEENLNQNSENVNAEIDNEAMNELFAQRLAKV